MKLVKWLLFVLVIILLLWLYRCEVLRGEHKKSSIQKLYQLEPRF